MEEEKTKSVFGTAAGLWRFPVKSMQGEELEEGALTSGGVVGDRAYALIDHESGRVVSAKSVKLFPRMLECRAAFVDQPAGGREMPPVRIELPSGSAVISDSPGADQALSEFFGREVRLARVAPQDYTIDQYHPDIEGIDPHGNRDAVVAQKLGSALFESIGADSPVPVGSFFDAFPLSVLTTSTLERLNELQPASRFDLQRFRMNLIVGTAEPGFVENGWIGRELRVGEAVRLRVTMPDPRCVMTMLPQGDLPYDKEILRTLARENRLQVGELGQYPCAGLYAVVTAPGVVRRGDPVCVC